MSAATSVESRLFGALAVLRAIVLLNTIGLTIYRSAAFDRLLAAWAGVGVMALWTAFATWAYAAPGRRTHLLLGVDLALATGLLLATPLVKTDGFGASLPGFWVAGALLAWAIRYRTYGGLLAGLVLAAADLVMRPHFTQGNYGNSFLLVIAGPVVGYMSGSLQQMATERDAAERASAAAAERGRLARAVHDGVLQTLAMVQRDGATPGLAELAATQERELRALIRAEAREAPGRSDLVAALRALEAPTVTVSAPGYAVEVAPDAARELVAAAAACLDNVRRHAGAGCPAYVLLQARPDRIEVSVRDDGPGIAPGRLEQAEREGRLGVKESIRGRLVALGGTAELTTGPDGTEWELTLPRTAGTARPAGTVPR